MPHWKIAEAIPSDIKQQFPEIHPVILQVLWNRGVQTQEAIDIFLGPDWHRDTHDPFLFRQMKPAVERIFHALKTSEVITIHGDYDADGVCGSAVLFSTLRDICRAGGFDPKKLTTYIPHREKEGYGMSPETIAHLHEHEKARIVITVDCGISNRPAIVRAKEFGIDTIVCDHHTMPAELPTEAILIHPLVPGEMYPNKSLCGTGVAFKLACALVAHARSLGLDIADGYEKWLLDLVAIATVTDVMPLLDENRTLEHFGLIVLNKTRRVGLKKLIEIAGAKLGSINTTTIGFQIGPRINAAGRMTHANEALNLLIEEDVVRAGEIAARLHEINIDRQKASEAMYLEARAQFDLQIQKKVFVAVGENWSAGLVGLVAGKLCSELHLPVYVVGKLEEKFVGSGRGAAGFDVTEALRQAAPHLDRFGGHPEACGFSTVGIARFAAARECIEAFAFSSITDEQLQATLAIDAEIPLEEIDWSVFEGIEQCRPFGQKNPTPLFLSRAVQILSARTVGAGDKHLKLTVQSHYGKIVNAIGFGLGDRLKSLGLGDEIDVVYEIDVNEWNGNRELQMKVVDIKKSQE